MEWLALIALLACVGTGAHAYRNWDYGHRQKAYALGALTLALFVFGKIYMPSQGENCHTAWDGRGNPTECD